MTDDNVSATTTDENRDRETTTISWTGDDDERAASVGRAMTAADMGLLDTLPRLIGDEISARRRARHWSKRELAEAVGVDPETIRLWESGTHMPTPPNLQAIADVLGLEDYD
jgi:DNA-binding transcriptional regulator YiaG